MERPLCEFTGNFAICWHAFARIICHGGGGGGAAMPAFRRTFPTFQGFGAILLRSLRSKIALPQIERSLGGFVSGGDDAV